MNLIDAIKSGKPFRRSTKLCTWCHAADDGLWEAIGHEPGKHRRLFLDRDDVLADDWEIQEPTVTITKSQFLGAYASVLKDIESRVKECRPGWSPHHHDVVADMAKQLGLE